MVEENAALIAKAAGILLSTNYDHDIDSNNNNDNNDNNNTDDNINGNIYYNCKNCIFDFSYSGNQMMFRTHFLATYQSHV